MGFSLRDLAAVHHTVVMGSDTRRSLSKQPGKWFGTEGIVLLHVRSYDSQPLGSLSELK